jgi:hypothetical protein
LNTTTTHSIDKTNVDLTITTSPLVCSSG